MTNDADADAAAQRFVRRMIGPTSAIGGHRDLGITPMARQLGLSENQLGGHWCSRCRGIWWGCMLEVQC
jgi:hypothetical protein